MQFEIDGLDIKHFRKVHLDINKAFLSVSFFVYIKYETAIKANIPI
jgi:hypothetical protein